MYVLCLGLSFFPVTSLILGERASREQESAGTKLTPRCKIVGARAHADAALCVALPWPILSRVINCKLFRLRNVAVVVVPVAVYEVGQRAANTIMPARRRQEEEGKKAQRAKNTQQRRL